MGLIKAAVGAIGTNLADQWLEVIEAAPMKSSTCFAPGVRMNNNQGKGANKKGSDNSVSNGSKIIVRDNEFMMLINNGKIAEYSAEPGEYIVDNSSTPSMLNGQFGQSLSDAFERFKFGGINANQQQVFYINLQELKGITFGTSNPIMFRDRVNNCMAKVRAHGNYTLKITNPILFYQNVIPKDKVTNNQAVDFNDLNKESYREEFVMCLEESIKQLSADGVDVADAQLFQRKIAGVMQDGLDEAWNQDRGMQIGVVSVSITPDEATLKAWEAQQKVAMFNRPDMAATMYAMNVSEGIKAAGSNANGSAAGFMGVGLGMNASGNMMGGMFQNPYANQQQQQGYAQPQQPAQQVPQQASQNENSWTCSCGNVCTGKFCPNCGSKQPEPKESGSWTCSCGNVCTGKFCPNCGSKKPDSGKWICSCGTECTGAFCPNCGSKKP